MRSVEKDGYLEHLDERSSVMIHLSYYKCLQIVSPASYFIREQVLMGWSDDSCDFAKKMQYVQVT